MNLPAQPIPFAEAGRLPQPGDNAAIAIRRLEAGTEIAARGGLFSISSTILEGHRFAVCAIGSGEPLLSWGLPFGLAVKPIGPGDYVCNEKILKALAERHVDFALPSEPNFKDYRAPFALDEQNFRAGRQVSPSPVPAFFEGYLREQNRGVGTRNFIVVLGTTSRTGSFAKAVAERFAKVPALFKNIDGVVAIAHTEGGGPTRPNNFELLRRTLGGFLRHPNVAAFLALDYGTEPVTNALLEDYMRERGDPLDSIPHRFLSIAGDTNAALEEAVAAVAAWLEPVNRCRRTAQPLAHLKFGLQCGGSDAFSGVSGNPLVGRLSRELVRLGGAANLAETDELIGAEHYVLGNVRNLETARAFLAKIQRFQEWAGWHGHSAEGNPSGGNNFRGLYNIAIKSIGAARKKDPDVRLDYVIDYADPMPEPGFYFMDSPGNDLESIAGQVASGCNLILFATGNGSITNFPFVPTIKIMTTSDRFRLLQNEMDFNAGRYQDGESMDDLGREAFDYTLRVASGLSSVGEKAGHAQTQIWREWRQSGRPASPEFQAPRPSGQPLRLRPGGLKTAPPPFRFEGFQTPRGLVSDRVGLIVPTSLCAGQIGLMIARQLNAAPRGRGPSCYVALAHTEGCGNSGGYSEKLLLQTMSGYAAHPLAEHVLLLEHGCEKTHNDALRNFLRGSGADISRFGWASVQMDGGIGSVSAKVKAWFERRESETPPPALLQGSLQDLRLGVTAFGAATPAMGRLLAALVRLVVEGGGTVVVPGNSVLWTMAEFSTGLLTESPAPTLEYGQAFREHGLHVMDTPTEHPVETLTGLGATGVEIILALVDRHPLQSHPMIPTLQIADRARAAGAWANELDLVLDAASPEAMKTLLNLISATASRVYTPKISWRNFADFQMTRGLEGISL